MASVSESEVYSEIKLEVLEELRVDLCRTIPPDKIINYLRSKKVFDIEDAENIKAQSTLTAQRGKLLDILITKGPYGFDEFCRAINTQCTGQEHILQKILTLLDEKRRDRVPKEPVSVYGDVPSCQGDSKPVVIVTGLPPVPGEYGAPTPPDELNDQPNCSSNQAQPAREAANSPPPSYSSESPPPYSE